MIEVNSALEASPGTVNEDASGAGWFVKIKLSDASELTGLMSEAEYQAYLRSIA